MKILDLIEKVLLLLIIIYFSILIIITAGAEELGNCLYILNKLTPKNNQGILDKTTANAYITLQKDIVGKSSLTSPVHTGIKINIPLLDNKEKYQLLKEHLRNIQNAYRTLSQYLTLKAKVEEEKQYLKWQWERVKTGIEYKKDIWEKQIKYKEDLANLKALEIYFKSLGINKKILSKCYKSTLENQ